MLICQMITYASQKTAVAVLEDAVCLLEIVVIVAPPFSAVEKHSYFLCTVYHALGMRIHTIIVIFYEHLQKSQFTMADPLCINWL